MSATPVPSEFSRVLRQWNPTGAERFDVVVRDRAPSPRMRVLADEGLDPDAFLAALDARRRNPLPATGNRDAAVILVLLDASAPIGRAMLTELRGIPDSARVVMMLDRIHRHADWRAVYTRTRESIDRYVPRLATVPIGTDLEATDAALDAALAGDDWALRTRLCALDAAADGARRALAEASRRARTADDIAALRRERVRLLAERDGGRHDRTTRLRSVIAGIRVDLAHAVGVRARGLATAATDSVSRAGADFPAVLEHEIDSATTEVNRIVDDALTGAGIPGVEPGGVRVPAIPIPGPGVRRRTAEDWLTMALGLSAGIGIGRVLSVLLPSAASLAVTLAAAAVVAVVTAVVRDRASTRAHLRRWAGEVIADVRASWERAVAAAVVQAESDAAVAIAVETRARSAEVDTRTAEIDDALRAASVAIAGRSAGYERDLAALERGADALRRSWDVEPLGTAVRPTR